MSTMQGLQSPEQAPLPAGPFKMPTLSAHMNMGADELDIGFTPLSSLPFEQSVTRSFICSGECHLCSYCVAVYVCIISSNSNLVNHHLIFIYQQAIGQFVPPDQLNGLLEQQNMLNHAAILHTTGLHGSRHGDPIVEGGDLLTFFVPAHHVSFKIHTTCQRRDHQFQVSDRLHCESWYST